MRPTINPKAQSNRYHPQLVKYDPKKVRQLFLASKTDPTNFNGNPSLSILEETEKNNETGGETKQDFLPGDCRESVSCAN